MRISDWSSDVSSSDLHLSIDRHPAGARKARALVLTTSREREQHIHESFRAYGRFVRLSQATVYEGPGKAAQAQALSRGIDILIGTPGRVVEPTGEPSCRERRSEYR